MNNLHFCPLCMSKIDYHLDNPVTHPDVSLLRAQSGWTLKHKNKCLAYVTEFFNQPDYLLNDGPKAIKLILETIEYRKDISFENLTFDIYEHEKDNFRVDLIDKSNKRCCYIDVDLRPDGNRWYL